MTIMPEILREYPAMNDAQKEVVAATAQKVEYDLRTVNPRRH
jgi:hypothetical protein